MLVVGCFCLEHSLTTYSDVEKKRKGDVSWNALAVLTPSAIALSVEKCMMVVFDRMSLSQAYDVPPP